MDVVFGGGGQILQEMYCLAQKKKEERRSGRHRKGKMANSEKGEEDDVKTKDEQTSPDNGPLQGERGDGKRKKEVGELLKTQTTNSSL